MPHEVIQPHTKIAPPPCLTIWLTWWTCNWDSPSLTQHQTWPSNWKSIDFSLFTKYHPIPIMDYNTILMTLSKLQPATRNIHSCQWATTSSTSLMTQNLLHEAHASLCRCSLPHSSVHLKHSSCLQHYLVHQLWWLLHMLVVGHGWCFWGALLLKAPHEKHTLYKSYSM